MGMKKSGATRLLALSGFIALAAACATDTVVITGRARPPISPADVKIYSRPPAVFEEIAVLNASKNSAFSTGGHEKLGQGMTGLKGQAGEEGAERVVLEGFPHRPTRWRGAGAGM